MGNEELFKEVFFKSHYNKLLIFQQMKEDIEEFKEDNMIKEEDSKLLVENFEEKFDELVKSKLRMFLTPTNISKIVGLKTAAKL